MTPNIQIQRDLLDLYCKVKHSSIESLLIKVSSANDMLMWLKKNDESLNKLVKNPNVIFALSTLTKLRQSMPVGQKLERSWVVKNMFEIANKLTPVMKAFIDVLSLDILMPYEDLITSLSEVFKLTPSKSKAESDAIAQEKQSIISDITLINDMYVKQATKEDAETENGREKTRDKTDKAYQRKPSIKQQRKDMSMSLLRRFSMDIGNAYESRGLSDIAQQFKQGILIKDPSAGVGSLFKTDMLSAQELGIVPILIDFIWKNYDIRRLDYNYGAIKTYLLNRVGVMTHEDFASIYAEHEKNKNTLDFFENSDSNYPGLNLENKVSIDNEMNPRYAYLLSVFLNKLMSKII